MSNYNETPTTSEVAEDVQEQPPAAEAAAAAGDCVWDSLHATHRNVQQFSLAPALVVPFLRQKEIVAKVDKPRELLAHAELLAKDMTQFSQDLNAIAATHADRTGSSTDADDLVLAIQTNEQYIAWTDRFNDVVMPTVIEIMGKLQSAGVDVNNLPKVEAPAALMATDVPVDYDAGTEETNNAAQ